MTRFSMELHTSGEHGKHLAVCFTLDHIHSLDDEGDLPSFLFLTFKQLERKWEAEHRPAEFD